MADAESIPIRVNGEEFLVGAGETLAQVVVDRGFSLEAVAVAVNGEVRSRSLLSDFVLQPGDAVEIVRAVGGG